MTLARIAPNSITPDGVDIMTAIENDNTDIKNLYSQMNDFGTNKLPSDNRQAVLYASTDVNGDPNYLTASGLNVSIDGSVTPVILAFAAGFDTNGAVDYVDTISSLISNAWTLPSNATSYLYVDKDVETGLLSYGYSALADLYQKLAPTVALDQHWYDTVSCKMKRYNGSAWEIKRRVFIAKAVTGASLTTLNIYPLGSKTTYDAEGADAELSANKLGKTENAVSATKLETARTINGVSFDGTANITISAGSAPGVTDYIAEGRKFGTPNGLSLPLTAGVDAISDKAINRDANSITLTARRAALVCDDADGNTTALYAAYPTAVSDTIHRWIINGDGTIASTVGTNSLTKTSTVTAADGRVGYAGLGAGGYYTAANATNVPAYSSAFTLRVPIDKFVSNGAAQCFYHDGVRKVACNSSNNLLVGGVDTGYTLENGKAYSIEEKGAGGTTTGDVFVNGVPVYSGAVVINATVVSPKIFANTSNAELCYSVIGYVEILSVQTTNQTSGDVAAGLLIPVCYDKSSAAYPTISAADKATAWHEWRCDETSGTAVADSAGTLNGTATGTTIVDSEWGLGKARRFNGTSDKISLGNYTFQASLAIIAVAKSDASDAYRCLLSSQNTTNTQGVSFDTSYNGNGKLTLWSVTSGAVASENSVPIGKSAFLAANVKDNMATLYVDSKTPDSIKAFVPDVSNSLPLYIGNKSNLSTDFWKGTLDYLLIIPRALSQAEIAEIYDALMSTGRRSLKSLLPAGSISLGYAETGSSGVNTVNDADWAYGRREGAAGGNRVVTQDYKIVVASTPDSMKWQPPFGACAKFRTDWRSAENASGLNDVIAATYAGYDATGVQTTSYKNGKIGALVGANGSAYVNAAWRTGGVLRPIFTLLEDDAV